MRKFFLIALLFSLFLISTPVSAQSTGPVYIVQPGDTLSAIAARFNVNLNDLMAANNITDPNLLSAGQPLVIPGLEGVTGILDTDVINFGDSYRSFIRRTQISPDLFLKLNRLVSPSEFYVGTTMIVPKQDNAPQMTGMTTAKGESLLELAVAHNTDPWTLSEINGLAGTWDGLPGDALYAPGTSSGQTITGLPPAFLSAEIPTLPLKQGGTSEIIVQPAQNVTSLDGTLIDYPLHFFPMGDGRQVALQGIHALLTPGVYPLRLNATLSDGTKQSYEQMVLINSGNFPKEALSVSSELIDPAVTAPEDKQVESITSPLTPTKYWQGVFIRPTYLPDGESPDSCIYDRFGTRRSFNGSDYIYFHSGIDYGYCFNPHPLDIYAAASGTVIFAGPLTVRGNATFIDHGWGVYTAYYHQKEFDVTVGEQVQTGQLIGLIGDTGRVTGPHLHFEVWVNGVQVNPLDWLNQPYP